VSETQQVTPLAAENRTIFMPDL